MDEVEYPEGAHHHLEPTGRDSVRPAHKRVLIVTLDNRWSHYYDRQVAAQLFDHFLGQRLREGVGVGVGVGVEPTNP